MCHVKCTAHAFNRCGEATDYARHYRETLRLARTTPTMRLSVADLKLNLSSYLKVPRYVCYCSVQLMM